MAPSWLPRDKLFRDRRDAGRELASSLRKYRGQDVLVLGLPRGGVPVAHEVALALDAPLDVCVVRKVGVPFEPELGIGAVAEGGASWINPRTRAMAGVSDAELAELIAKERREVEARVTRLRDGAPPVDVRGKIVLVVDDGIATGGTAHAAIETLRTRGARRVVLAAPVGAADSVAALSTVADEVVCPHAEESFYAVGQWYDDFSATSDAEVVELLGRARSRIAKHESKGARTSARSALQRNVQIPVGEHYLEAHLVVPSGARSIVLFAHGSGSGRHSPRNQFVAGELQREGHATLLLDLLTQEEEVIDAMTGHLRFDIGLLAVRLVNATEWVRQEPSTRTLDVGYFGASTGAAASLIAAAERPALVHAIVSRGGRPDLAEDALERVQAPTLLVVGGEDHEVELLNREAYARLRCTKALELVPRATHLFPESGALERVAELAADWFTQHLGKRARRGARLHV